MGQQGVIGMKGSTELEIGFSSEDPGLIPLDRVEKVNFK